MPDTKQKETKQRLLMLGAGLMQGVAIRAAKEMGCTVCAVDGNPHAVCIPEADEFVHIDLKDTQALITHARRMQEEEAGLAGVFTAATDFSAAVAAVAEACGLRSHRLDAALNATDKVRMRTCFRQAGVPSPAFTAFTAADLERLEALERAGETFAGFTEPEELAGVFPLVVKPVDNMGARGCRLVCSQAELLPALRTALSYSKSGTAIVEEYIDGIEFSTEGLVIDGKLFVTAIADRHIFFPPYFIEMGHTIPSNCSQTTADTVISVFEQGVAALGLTNGAAKGDILYKDGKAYVGEIAARLSGGYMSGWTVPYSSGLDVTKAALALALGRTPDVRMAGQTAFTVPLKQHCPAVSAERAWISIPGVVKKTYGYDRVEKMPFIKDVFPRVSAGDTVSFPTNNVEKCGNVISAAPTRDEAVFASEQACKTIVIRLEPNRKETDAFLAGLPDYPDMQMQYPPNFLQFDRFPYKTFKEAFENAPYKRCEDCYFLPDYLAAALDTAYDLQRRSLRGIFEQALAIEPKLVFLLCCGNEDYDHAEDFDTISLPERAVCWQGLIRGGIQGLLYEYEKIGVSL